MKSTDVITNRDSWDAVRGGHVNQFRCYLKAGWAGDCRPHAPRSVVATYLHQMPAPPKRQLIAQMLHQDSPGANIMVTSTDAEQPVNIVIEIVL